MAPYEIRVVGDPVLRSPAQEIDEIDDRDIPVQQELPLDVDAE